ncbi:hypothetical protein ACIQUL_29560 [Streptomyces sp. NPDC090303]|uniref:bestrophin-like domain n=1 Tax=Streptomyces sp. NPDC090303 TaxID=3365960 RepID=UPI00382ED64F
MLVTTILAVLAGVALLLLTRVAMGLFGLPPVREPQEALRQAAEVIMGVFALTSAFLIVEGYGRSDDAQRATVAEADAVRETFWSAGSLPAAERDRTRSALENYLRTVLDERPAKSRELARRAGWETLRDVHDDLLPPATADEGFRPVRFELRADLRDLYAARSQRIAKTDAALPDPVVYLLILGASGSVVLVALTGFPCKRREAGVLIFAAALTGITANVVVQIDRPADGAISVNSHAYDLVLREMTDHPLG